MSIRRSNPIDRSINSNLIHGGIRTIRQAAWLKLAWIKINPISKLADRREFPSRKSRTVFREDRKRKKRLEGTRGRRVACRELVCSTVRFVLSVSHSSSCSLLVPFTTRRLAEEAPPLPALLSLFSYPPGGGELKFPRFLSLSRSPGHAGMCRANAIRRVAGNPILKGPPLARRFICCYAR